MFCGIATNFMASVRIVATISRWARGAVFLLVATVGLTCRSGPPPIASSPTLREGVRLVVLISVDQLRADRLDSRLPGGLGWMTRSGRRFSEGRLDHARTDTCSGHATMLTGHQPAVAGLPGNTVVRRESLEIQYCVEDNSKRGAILGRRSEPKEGRSPRSLRVTALGDWLKDQDPNSKVYAVSAKDRSAIALGGRQPDAVFWLDRRKTGRITTSRYYLDRLPQWVEGWTVKKLLAPVPDLWTHPTGEPPNGVRADAFHGESTRWSMTSPHPVKPEGDTPGSIDAFLASPYVDARTLDFARQLVIEEDLGRRDAVDLLAIALSGTDFIGHRYGPKSQEAHDALVRLDQDLGSFLAFLRARVGVDHMIIVLTSDHGVLPLPEWLAARGGSCPVSGGRIDLSRFDEGLSAELDEVFGPGPEQADDVEPPDWFLRHGYEIFFRPETVEQNGASLERVSVISSEWIRQQTGVARVWRGQDIDQGIGPQPMVRLYQNSRLPGGEGADLVIEPAYGCLFASWPEGTSHGSPHDYDRDVPLVFVGPGIEVGTTRAQASPVDIAPTLAGEIGVEPPQGLSGRALPLRSKASGPIAPETK